MASCRAFINTVAIAAVLIQAASAATYNVGGTKGAWDLSTDVQTWASAQKFVPGDSLTFVYAPSHDVVEVTKTGYDSCSASNPIQSYTGGNTAVKLLAPGKRYFICGIPGHCSAGMKLEVDVVSAAAAATPPSILAPPKSTAAAPKKAPRLAPSQAPSASHESSAPSMAPEPPSTDLALGPASPPPKASAAHGLGLTKLAVGFAMGMLLMVLSL